MRDRQTCIDCGKQSPETETNYTLISAQFGWRLSRRRDKNGEFVVEWRCADCWRDHKKKLDAEAVAQGTPPKPGPERRDSQRFAAVSAPRSSMNTRAAPSAPSKPPPRASTRPSQAPEAGSSEPPRAAPPLPRPRRT